MFIIHEYELYGTLAQFNMVVAICKRKSNSKTSEKLSELQRV